MAVGFSRMSNIHLSSGAVRFSFANSDIVDSNQHITLRSVTKKKCCLRHVFSEYNKHILSRRWMEVRKYQSPFHKARRMVFFVPFASTDDVIAVNGAPQASPDSNMDEMRAKLNQYLQVEKVSSGLVLSIHDAARAIELAVREHCSSSKTSWFSKAWLGVDKNAWVKKLSYQAAVNALLQAVIEISSRGDRRDMDINIFVQRSLRRQCVHLENIIHEELSTKQPEVYEWFWSSQHVMVVTTYVDLFERDPRFTDATMLCWKGDSSGLDPASDISLLTLALSCLAAVKKLGSTKISCSQFFTMIPDTVGRLMDMLLDFVPIQKAYHSMKDIGLCSEFLFHFGPRAAKVKFRNDNGAEEIAFWIDLIQIQLQRAIDREKIWSRLTTCECIEVLEKDLTIFGFFIALGRSTQSFLSANGVSAKDDQVSGIIRYLIGGSVLYYPQLSSISSYQLFVEVVCEELEWLPFYQSNVTDAKAAENKGKQEGMPREEAISIVLDVCSYWMTSFIKYSTWLENPSNIKAAKFLSIGHSKLIECMKEVRIPKNGRINYIVKDKGNLGSETRSRTGTELDSFDKALESVEEALIRLEDLLQELHISNSNSGKEHLQAACSDLERIRKLKKEAEFLEASFRAKAASLDQVDADERSTSSASQQGWFSTQGGKTSNESESARKTVERLGTKPHSFWSFLVQTSTKNAGPGISTVDQNVMSSAVDSQETELNEIRRFELLRRELIQLEKKVQRSTSDSQNEEDYELENEDKMVSAVGNHVVVHEQKNNNVISKSIQKLKETSTDVWQGTQLLAIDVAAAAGLLKRALTGDELTEKEKKALRRTLTDMASVVPIGILMLLPVTAVGHAAMLAAIQRYVPALIPSTYGPERLDLLRQLEKVKEMETADNGCDEMTEAISSSSSNPQ
ncbi:uncharacterized protein A4U43_C03F3200 [Asparagus officinalis]|uniref:Uncharacterized protein n=1 Tax=Asparagus officinalis TaxID=4686 RepID=A0A5P1F7H9_ASPOF|nr:uncharacterized protein LOC109832792 [Asparagus officinalis]ONK74142.1 uncharacterized protein A4U43_C03F3200 [Asparagus officinalis]